MGTLIPVPPHAQLVDRGGNRVRACCPVALRATVEADRFLLAEPALAVRHLRAVSLDAEHRDRRAAALGHRCADERGRAGPATSLDDGSQARVARLDRCGLQVVAGEGQLGEDHQTSARTRDRRGVRSRVGLGVLGPRRRLRGRDGQLFAHGFLPPDTFPDGFSLPAGRQGRRGR
nr:hypothetical protein [Egibacter rhizosphaerae]